jgi:integrase
MGSIGGAGFRFDVHVVNSYSYTPLTCYSLRRRVATTLASMSRDQLASKGLLRHRSLATTQRHYIKVVPENTFSAMNQVEKLFNECSTMKQ